MFWGDKHFHVLVGGLDCLPRRISTRLTEPACANFVPIDCLHDPSRYALRQGPCLCPNHHPKLSIIESWCSAERTGDMEMLCYYSCFVLVLVRSSWGLVSVGMFRCPYRVLPTPPLLPHTP